MWSIAIPESEEPIFLSLVINIVSILFDIIILSIYYPRYDLSGYVVWPSVNILVITIFPQAEQEQDSRVQCSHCNLQPPLKICLQPHPVHRVGGQRGHAHHADQGQGRHRHHHTGWVSQEWICFGSPSRYQVFLDMHMMPTMDLADLYLMPIVA